MNTSQACPSRYVHYLSLGVAATLTIAHLQGCRREHAQKESGALKQVTTHPAPHPLPHAGVKSADPGLPDTAAELLKFLTTKRASSTHEKYLVMLSQLARTLPVDDAGIVKLFLEELPIGTDAQGPATVFLHRLAEKCTPDTYTAALQALASSGTPFQERYHEILLIGYAKIDPLAALKSLTTHKELLGPDKERERAAEIALANGIVSGKAPLEELLAAIPEDLPRGSIIATGEVGTELGKALDTQRFIELLRKAPYLTEQEQEYAASAFGYGLLLAYWPEEKRISILLQTLASESITPALRESIGDAYISSLSERDLNAALALVAKIPPGNIRDHIVSRNVGTIAKQDREAARVWGQTIADPSLREQTLESLQK